MSLIVCLCPGCDQVGNQQPAEPAPVTKQASDERGQGVTNLTIDQSSQEEVPASPTSPPIVAAARNQIGKTVVYDGAYVGLGYPNGDVPIERGVCTDVVVRALRDAHGIDLQKLVHEDMKANFAQYPTIWGLTRPDKNIDHRRVPNLQTFFKRQGYELTTGRRASDFEPGDLVTCTVGGNRPHIMVVSDTKTADGRPKVIHNIGRGVAEEDSLLDFPITGHYRVRLADDNAPG